MDCSHPGSSVHGILQAKILEWVAMPFSGIFWTRDQTRVSCFIGRFFTIWATREALGRGFLKKERLPWWLHRERICLQFRRHRRYTFNAWIVKIPWIRKWQPTPVFLPEKSHGQRSLMAKGAWQATVHKVAKSQAWLSTHTIKGSLFLFFFFSSYILYFGGNTVFSVNNKVDNLVRTCRLHQEK